MRQFWLFTNRNTIVFNHDGSQDVEAQSQIDCYTLTDEAQSVIDSCDVFYLSRWGEWKHEISKREIEYLLGLRTYEVDCEELREERDH